MYCSTAFRYLLTEKAIVELGFTKIIINTSWNPIFLIEFGLPGIHLTCPGASCSKDLPRRCSPISFPFPRVCYMFLFAGFKHNRLRGYAIHLFSWCLRRARTWCLGSTGTSQTLFHPQFGDTFSCKTPSFGMDSDDLTNFSHLTSRQIYRQPMAPSRSWKPTRVHHLAAMRNLRTIHMHLEGPGPIPVDDPEAAQCHWMQLSGPMVGVSWYLENLLCFTRRNPWVKTLPENIIYEGYYRRNTMQISLQDMTHDDFFYMFIVSGG